MNAAERLFLILAVAAFILVCIAVCLFLLGMQPTQGVGSW